MNRWTRRTFIGAGTIAGGGFLIGTAGFTFAPGRHSLVSASAPDNGQLTTWITVTPDNLVTILIPHCEMGQGTPTALATDSYLPADRPEYFTCTPGQKIAVIQEAAGGKLSVTEVT